MIHMGSKPAKGIAFEWNQRIRQEVGKIRSLFQDWLDAAALQIYRDVVSDLLQENPELNDLISGHDQKVIEHTSELRDITIHAQMMLAEDESYDVNKSQQLLEQMQRRVVLLLQSQMKRSQEV